MRKMSLFFLTCNNLVHSQTETKLLVINILQNKPFVFFSSGYISSLKDAYQFIFLRIYFNLICTMNK